MQIIDRRPEEFKIACLTDIAHLFFDDLNVATPYTAGFGNRMTDVVCYCNLPELLNAF